MSINRVSFLSTDQSSSSRQWRNCWWTNEKRLHIHTVVFSKRRDYWKEYIYIGERGTPWSAAASVTWFVCDFDVDVSGRQPRDRQLSWTVWMWPLSATSWSRCSATTAILPFLLARRITTAQPPLRGASLHVILKLSDYNWTAIQKRMEIVDKMHCGPITQIASRRSLGYIWHISRCVNLLH